MQTTAESCALRIRISPSYVHYITMFITTMWCPCATRTPRA